MTSPVERGSPRPSIHCRWIPLHIANAYVLEHHRHLRHPRGAVFALGAYADAERCAEGHHVGGRLCGVVLLGRPIARLADTGERWDVTRCATDGTPNAGSALYAAARRLAQAAGLLPPRTHTLPEESGASLRGAGYEESGVTGGGTWARKSRGSGQGDTGPKRQWRSRPGPTTSPSTPPTLFVTEE